MNRVMFRTAVLLLLVAVVALAMLVRERDHTAIRKTIERQGRRTDAVLDALELDTLDVLDPDGARWLVVRSQGESLENWYARADAIMAGEEAAGQECVTLHCKVGVVTICIACRPSETQQECQQRAQDAADVWCETHECDECD